MINFFKKFFKKEDTIADNIVSSFESFMEESQQAIDVAREITNYLSYQIDDTDNKLKMVCNLLSCQVIIVDMNNKIHFINEFAKNRIGLELKHNQMFFDIFKFENIDNIQDLFCSVNKNDTMKYFSIVANNKDLKALVRISSIEQMTGNLFAIVLLDVTDRINYENELLKTKNLFKFFSDISNDAIIQTDSENNILLYNQKFIDMTGGKIDLPNANMCNYIPDISMEGTFTQVETNFHIEGRYIPIVLNKKTLTLEERTTFFYVVRDITTFKAAKQLIEEKALRFYELLQYSYVSLVCFDENFSITYFNEIFVNEFDANLTTNKNILDYLSEEDKENFKAEILSLNEDKPVCRKLHFFKEEYKDWICFKKVKNEKIEYQCSIRDVTSYSKNNIKTNLS